MLLETLEDNLSGCSGGCGGGGRCRGACGGRCRNRGGYGSGYGGGTRNVNIINLGTQAVGNTNSQRYHTASPHGVPYAQPLPTIMLPPTVYPAGMVANPASPAPGVNPLVAQGLTPAPRAATYASMPGNAPGASTAADRQRARHPGYWDPTKTAKRKARHAGFQ